MKPRNHTPGQTRYIHYFLYFPDDSVWQDCFPFAQPIDVLIKNFGLYKNGRLDICQRLMRKGDTHWKDRNGITHRMMIAEREIPRIWGKNRG